MNPILDLLSQGWTGTVVGVIGILVGITCYLWSRRRAGLAYQFDAVTLIGGCGPAFPEEVEVRFSGTPVLGITASRIVLWNCGNTTLSGQDIVDTDPLRIELPRDAQFLKHSLLRATRDVNGWQTEPSSKFTNHLLLRFDFLDPGDGVAIEAVHTDTSRGLKVTGTMRGMPYGVGDLGRESWFCACTPFSLIERRLNRSVAVVASVVMMLLPGLFFTQLPAWGMVVAGFLSMIFPAMILWSSRRRYPAALEPDAAQGDGHKSGAS